MGKERKGRRAEEEEEEEITALLLRSAPQGRIFWYILPMCLLGFVCFLWPISVLFLSRVGGREA